MVARLENTKEQQFIPIAPEPVQPCDDNSETNATTRADAESGAARSQAVRQNVEAIAALPRDVGWFLLVGGLLSELGAPGVPPFWILGIIILWPRVGQRIGETMQRRAPKLFCRCISLIKRYAGDLEQRYPRRR